MNCLPITYNIKEISISELLKFFNISTIRSYCKSCPSYNKTWSCPDYDFSEEEYIKKYKFAYIIGAKLYYNKIEPKINELKSQGKKDMDISTELYYTLRKIVDKKIFSVENSFKNSKCLLAGKCNLCPTCAKEHNFPCTHPEKLRYSLESLGFEVSSITENILKDKIIFTKDSLPPYSLCIYAVFSKEKISESEILKILAS